MHNRFYPHLSIIPLIFLITLLSCETEPSEKMSEDVIWLDGSEVQGTTGSTMLGDLDDMGTMTDMFWTSPASKLKSYLSKKQFVIDTTRLKQLASYAYTDLRETSFLSLFNELLINPLEKELHSMGSEPSLIRGVGYYYAQTDSVGGFTGVDLGFEHWRVDTTNLEQLDLLVGEWKENYHPMPFYTVINDDYLYVLYTRSVQFAPFLESCVDQLESFNS